MVLTCPRIHLLFIMHFFVAACAASASGSLQVSLNFCLDPPPHKALGWREPIHLRKGSASLKVATSVMAVEFGRVFSRGCVELRCRYFLDLKAGKWPSCAEMDRPGFRFVFWQDKRSFPVCRGQWCLHSFLIRFWSACFQAAKTLPQWLNLDDWSCMFVSRERLCHCRQWPLCACVCGAVLVLFCEPLFPSSWRPPLMR